MTTYRIQFNKAFTFKDLEAILPFLHDLGVKTIYASPIFEAVPGSTHGYDGVNPNEINPEIGTLAELRALAAALRALGMLWIQDIVPNHMGFHHLNTWLMDVLKKGEASDYRKYFDILSPDLAAEPLMVPFLGDDLEREIENGTLELVENQEAWFLKYHESYWPLKVGTDLKKPLKSIVNEQYYRLCCYKESHEKMNYRRFFTVNSLICMNIQDKETFDAYHRLTKELLDEGVFQGLRIDHVDGLYDPPAYLQELRQLCGVETYIVVEKILEPGEELPNTWPVQGTTGYDFLGLANQVFINEKAEMKFDQFYKNFGHPSSVQTQIRKKKKDYLHTFMKGELENLYQLFLSLDLIGHEEKARNNPRNFKQLIAQIMVYCPVYRYYGNQYPLPQQERDALRLIFKALKNDETEQASLIVLEDILLHKSDSPPEYQQRILMFYQRLMQFTGPLMAKGVEDTLMYTYNRFIGSNEVGDSPDVFGISAADFHQAILKRQEQWPLTMNATSTHDTKRGEDARARLQILTDLRQEWLEEVKRWQEVNQGLKQQDMPDANDEYFIYQSLVATYPEPEEEEEHYLERLHLYLEKALRESKRNSSWEEPDADYERNTKDFISSILDKERPFWTSFKHFHQKVCLWGRLNSLSALLLKFGCPGVPDTYQGDGLWDLSLVDPDNRRPVDYELREKFLNQIKQGHFTLESLWMQGVNGKIKMFLLHHLFNIRNQYPLLFSEGQYLPITIKGKHAAHLLSFARHYKSDWLVFVMPLNLAAVVEDPQSINAEFWEDTSLVMPDGIPEHFSEQLGNRKGISGQELEVKEILGNFPMAILHFKQELHPRGAGVLMPVFSLPAASGIGDFGSEARHFIDFLVTSGQKYWQLLPLNPVNQEQAYSPYSAVSVMAGNTLFISPELLVMAGLLSAESLEKYTVKASNTVKYKKVEKLKNAMLHLAYENFKKRTAELGMIAEFAAFCEQEAYWLDDYALFQALKESSGNKPWQDWPAELKNRDLEALKTIVNNQGALLEEIKWQQFIFYQQWASLKKYANSRNILLIGDLPFYAALDSADVWASPALFNMDEHGQAQGIAGVPPDYFNEDGQLWGMPVYNWEAMAQKGYAWWVARLRKNMQLFDLIRLDHFRAFSAYWEVPAGSETAKIGNWKPGPGIEFFDVLKKHFKHLPFLAEDLGEIDAAVYQLRDALKLPGMKVLQFAFGADAADSIHAPHNYPNQNAVVYTGTHDNNTILGWYKNDISKAEKKRISNYAGCKVSKQNIHQVMIRLAYSTVARIAVIPMQDILGKSAKSRMNTPASVNKNWLWRLKPGSLAITANLKNKLNEMVRLYAR
ncbi:malto-oligosyltrehalose synthase [Pedobacter immunditicola]|uniref:malto-oligosyltrehalose synthase n=1 Tax=Pedobacter immunditicola TaxID=3133440 RepID=UPI0030AD3A1E